LPSGLRLWEVATRRQIGSPLTGHTDAVDAVAFSPDGKTLASGSQDQIVRLWDVAYLVDPVSYLCASAGRPLTQAEWARSMPPGAVYQQLCP
jgi:WD40 repeat protein